MQKLMKVVWRIMLLMILIMGSMITLIYSNFYITIANYFMPSQWTLTSVGHSRISLNSVHLPTLKVFFHEKNIRCQLITLNNTALSWANMDVSVQKVAVNYQCLNDIELVAKDQRSTTPTKVGLNEVFPLLPLGQIYIDKLIWTNTVNNPYPQLQPLLNSTLSLSLRYISNNNLLVNLDARADNRTIAKLAFKLNKVTRQLSGDITYIPKIAQVNYIKLNAKLKPELLVMPKTLKIVYQWNNPLIPTIHKGQATLNYQNNKGNISIERKQDTDYLPFVSIPFSGDLEQLNIQRAKISIPSPEGDKLTVYVNMQISAEQSQTVVKMNGKNSSIKSVLRTSTETRKTLLEGLPILVNARLSMISDGTKGKGALVFQIKNGVIRHDLDMKLRIDGEYKYNNTVAYINTPLHLKGTLDNPVLSFLTGSLVRVGGTESGFKFEEVRLPLAGIRVSKKGVNGHLQAIVKGQTLQYKNINLHLDGYAHSFTAGIETLFDLKSFNKATQSQLKLKDSNTWNWRFWGNADLIRLGNHIMVQGKGNWHGTSVILNQLLSRLTRFKLSNVTVEPINATLSSPLEWNYKENTIDGKLNITTNKINFSYGGQLNRPNIDVTLSGQNLSDFNLKGELKAGKVGPILLFSRYHHGHLQGNLYWLRQSTKVLQSLIPSTMKWLIQKGQVKGEIAYSVDKDRGLLSGGHIVIKQSNIVLPNGNINGINFVLPYRYQNGRFKLGIKQPVQVNIKTLNYGVPITNLAVKLEGYFPYTRQHFLKLGQLGFNLLGGSVYVKNFALPQHKVAYLDINNIDLSSVASLLKYSQISVSGRVNAKFPFWLENSPCLICNGVINKIGKDWHVQLSQLLLKDIAENGGITEKILVNLLQQLTVSKMHAIVNMQTDGDTRIRSQIRTYNQDKQLINLNYNHHENMFKLWSLINFGNEFDQQLEHKIYQVMDKYKALKNYKKNSQIIYTE